MKPTEYIVWRINNIEGKYFLLITLEIILFLTNLLKNKYRSENVLRGAKLIGMIQKQNSS